MYAHSQGAYRSQPITMDMIHPQWHLHWHAQVPEADEEHVSPTSKIIKKLKVSIEGLHGSQLQPFLSRLDEVLDERPPMVQNPLPLTKERGRPVGAKTSQL